MGEQKNSEEIKKGEESKVSEILSSIQVALDEYDDIFSDFDPSPYTKRLLSEDFLKEIQRRYIETGKGEIEVRFTLPAALRDAKTEALIKKRIAHYFDSKIKSSDEDTAKIRRKGLVHLIAGFLLLSADIFIYDIKDIFIRLISVITVPAGWYGMYSGLEYMFAYPGEIMERRKFYQRFERAKYEFISEEELVEKVEVASKTKEEAREMEE